MSEPYAMFIAHDKGLKINADGTIWQFDEGKLELRGDQVEEFRALLKRRPIILAKCREVDFAEGAAIVARDRAMRKPAAIAGAVTTQPQSLLHNELEERKRAEELVRSGVSPELLAKEGLVTTERVELPPRVPGNVARTGEDNPNPQTQTHDFVVDLQKAQAAKSAGGVNLSNLLKK